MQDLGNVPGVTGSLFNPDQEIQLSALGNAMMVTVGKAIAENWNASLAIPNVSNLKASLLEYLNVLLGATCVSFDSCKTCSQQNAYIINSNKRSLLPDGVKMANEGWNTKDCFLRSVVTDFLYVDNNGEYQKCISNCKRCERWNECNVCGRHGHPDSTYYLIQNTNNHICSSKCDAADNRHKLPASPDREFDCVECDANTYYLEGTNPAQCVACDGTGQSKVGKGCYQCDSGCGS